MKLHPYETARRVRRRAGGTAIGVVGRVPPAALDDGGTGRRVPNAVPRAFDPTTMKRMRSSKKTLPTLKPATVEHVCGKTFAGRGREVFRRGQVLAVTAPDGLAELMGLVLGTAPEPYVQFVSLDSETGFANECTCPVGESCKHVAAVLYHYLAHREDILRGISGPDGQDASNEAAALERWLGTLGEAGELLLSAPDEPPPGSHVMLYEIELNARTMPRGRAAATANPVERMPPVRMALKRSRRLMRGGYGKEAPASVSTWHVPDWCTPIDRDILALLADTSRRQYRYGYSDQVTGIEFSGTSGARLLRLLAESGRGFVGEGREYPIGSGGARALALDWQALPGGRTRLAGTLDGLAFWTLVPTEPPYYLGVEMAAAHPDGADGAERARRGGDAARSGHGIESSDDIDTLHGIDAEAGEFVNADEFVTRVSESTADRIDTALSARGNGARVIVGPIGRAPTAPLLHALLSGPALEPEGARRASEFLDGAGMRERLAGAAPPLSAAEDTLVVDLSPVPVLVLHAREASTDPLDFRARFVSRYGQDRVAFEVATIGETHLRVEDEDGRRLVRRRLDEEMARAQELADHCPALAPLEGEPGALAPPADDVPACVLAWRELLDSLHELEALGWEIDTQPPFGIEFERLDSVEGHVGESENGWFDLSLAMVHEGQRFALLPLIVDWLEADEPDRPILVESEAGTWLEIAPAVYMPVAETLIELYDHLPDGEELRLPRQRAPLLDALDEAFGGNVLWQGGEALFALAERLKQFDGVSRPALPDTLEATLRPYQHDGVAWLGFLAEYGFGGILADDMGLGKTLQTLAHLLVEREAGRLDGPTLIVAPTSLLGNWQREAERFAPSLQSLIWHGAERHAREHEIATVDLLITSYTLALRERDLLAGQTFACLVLDEAQVIKNPQSKTARAVKSLPVERRLCLSGTPLENHLGELWSQFDFLMPDYLGNRDRFTRRFRTPIEKHGDEERQRRLNALVRPFMLRRRKEEVAKELPPKTDIVQSVTLGAAQGRLYESIRLSMEAKVRKLLSGKGLARSRIELLDALLKLRQTCCHPALVKLPSARKVQESAKTEQLMAMLEEMIAEGRRILLFSQFTEMLALIEDELAQRDIAFVKLTGRTRRRDVVVDAFQSGEVPLFLISLKAGGTGLNLTAADTVIHYDPWWNPAVEAQASARAHRIGQDKPVFVYRLVAADTVEERILEMQARKQALADATVDGEGGALAGMTADELLGLFSARDG